MSLGRVNSTRRPGVSAPPREGSWPVSRMPKGAESRQTMSCAFYDVRMTVRTRKFIVAIALVALAELAIVWLSGPAHYMPPSLV